MKKAKRDFADFQLCMSCQQLTLDQASKLFIKNPDFRKYFWLMSCVNLLLDTSERKKLN